MNLLKWDVFLEAMNQVGKATMGLGICMWMKVVAEDYMNGIAGFLSLDLSERVVREKTGSGLVVCSMILHLIAASSSSSLKIHRTSKSKREFPRYLTYGKAYKLILLCFWFKTDFCCLDSILVLPECCINNYFNL